MNALYLVALAAGMISSLQSTLNTRLAQSVGGPIAASLFSVILTGVCLLAIALVTSAPMVSGASLSAAPWWAWTGGLLGAAFLVSIIFAIKGLGVASAISFVIGAQIFTALLLDQFGVHGGAATPITLSRAVGAVLLVAGVWLINKQG